MQKGYRIENRLISSCILPATGKLAEKLKVSPGSDIFELVRLRIVEDVPVSLESAYLSCANFTGINKYDFVRLSLYSVLERKYSVVLGGGIEEISLTYADANEARLLEVEEGEALFYLKGITWDENKEPVELIKSVSRTDRLSFAGILQ
jgi:GntR family transcriptional regulator